MPPDKAERWPGQGTSALDITRGDGDTASITPPPAIGPFRAALGPALPRQVTPGCPCGCETVLPWYTDPACGTRRGIREARPWAAYDVETLGLAPHDRELCPECQAVGA